MKKEQISFFLFDKIREAEIKFRTSRWLRALTALPVSLNVYKRRKNVRIREENEKIGGTDIFTCR